MKDRLKYIVYRILGFLFHIMWIFPVDKNKMIVNAFGGKGYCDNPRYIVDELLNRGCRYKILWLVNDKSTPLPDGVKPVKRHSLAEWYGYATSKIWIDNSRIPLYVRKKKKQKYIETWHGGFALKKIGKSSKSSSVCGWNRVLHDSKTADLMLSNSKFCTDIYRNDFLYTGQILECGSPRLDILFKYDESLIKNVYRVLDISENVKIALYAPTFRETNDMKVFDVDYKRLKDSLAERFGGEWVVLVRFHPKMTAYASSIRYNEWLKNATVVPDIYELLCATNVLITDYSSTALEFAVLDRPVFLFTADLERYQKTRGLYFKIQELPFPIAYNNDELSDAVMKYEPSEYNRGVHEFMKKIGSYEKGNASSAAADYIEQQLTGK